METLLLFGGNIIVWFHITGAILSIATIVYGCYLFNKTTKRLLDGVC